MRAPAWGFALAAAGAFAAFDLVRGGDPLLAAAAVVGASVVLALLAHGGRLFAGEAVIAGALAALVLEALAPWLPLVAGGAWLALLYGTRAARARRLSERALHISVAFLAGVAATWVVSAYTATSVAAVALGVGALLAAAPQLLPADHVGRFALRRQAARARGPLRVLLLRAVVAHRTLHALELPRALRRRVATAFAELRVRAERLLARDQRDDRELRLAVARLLRLARAARAKEELLDGLSPTALDADPEGLETEVEVLTRLSPAGRDSVSP